MPRPHRGRRCAWNAATVPVMIATGDRMSDRPARPGNASTVGIGKEPTMPAMTVVSGDGSPAADLPRPAARIGRYVVGRVLGAGAMGVVYLAHDPSLDRAVALKVIHHRGTTRVFRE